MAKLLPEYSKAIRVEPSFYMPDIDGVDKVRQYLEEGTDAQCNFAGCGERKAPKKSNNIPSLWEEGNPLNTPNVPTLDGNPLDTKLFQGGDDPSSGKNSRRNITGGAPSNCIHCYICGFPIDGRRGIALDIQNAWGGQCEHVMAVAALATLCGLAGDNYEDIVNEFLTDCNITDPKYKVWRERLVKQAANVTKNKEGGGPHGILYKWAHPGCNEIKGSHPYLRIDFAKIAEDSEGWFTDLLEASNMSFSGGGKIKGGGPTPSPAPSPADIFCDEVMEWNLACVSGLNKGHKNATDGGKKSMYWRKRYNLYKNGIININVDDKNFGKELKELVLLYKDLYSIDKSNKVEKKNKEAEIKLKQRSLIKDDPSLTTIELIKDGVSKGEKPITVWIDERKNHMKETILKPIIANIVNVDGDDEEQQAATLRKYICISQCVLTQVFEKNLTTAVAKVNPGYHLNWSYAPASQLSSMIIGLAFEEITDLSDTTKIKEIKDKYEDRLKNIPRTIKDSIKELKKHVKDNLIAVKGVLQTKKVAMKSAVKKGGAKMKNKISSFNILGHSYSLRKRSGGGRINKKTIRKKSEYLGGKRGKIPYRIFTFTSNDKELEEIIKNKCHSIYSNELVWVSNIYHKLSPNGESRISKWFTLLLVESSETDKKYIEKYDYRFIINNDPNNPLPLYFNINVVAIQKSKDFIKGSERLSIDIEKDLFKKNDNVYNLAMFMYLTVLSMNNNITKHFIKELIYLFILNFIKRLEMMGIKLKNNSKVRKTTLKKPRVDEILLLKKPRVEKILVYSNTDIRGGLKRKKKKKKKIKRYYKGGDKVYSPSMEGLISVNNILNNSGTNYISDYMMLDFIEDDGSYKNLIEGKELDYVDIGKDKYERAFIDIMKIDNEEFDYEDNTEYGDIIKPGVDMGFDKDPVFSQLMDPGKDDIRKLGILIKEKWTQADIQYDNRDIRIFYILGMIDYLTNIKIFSNNGSNGDDPVIDYLTSDDNPISVFSEKYEGESKYYEDVKDRCTKLLTGFPEDLYGDLLSYFGKSYGTDGKGVSDQSKIHNTIEGVSNIHTKITNFVCNITIINVLTYPYVRCYVAYDPAFKRYMWNYDSIGLDNDGSEITNFCRAKNRRIQQIQAEGFWGSSINPYRLAYDEDNEPSGGWFSGWFS